MIELLFPCFIFLLRALVILCLSLSDELVFCLHSGDCDVLIVQTNEEIISPLVDLVTPVVTGENSNFSFIYTVVRVQVGNDSWRRLGSVNNLTSS